jgi:hypothetical protein
MGMPVEDPSMIGKTVSHCRIIEKLGQGSVGAVYPAEDTNLRDYDAVKILPHEFPPDTDGDERLKHYLCELLGSSPTRELGRTGPRCISAYPFEEV